jgi:hypothetical protein
VPVAAVDWTQVLVALIAAIPAILAAVAALSVRRSVQTPSGRSLGKQVEDGLHTGLGNAYRLETLRQHVGADPTIRLPDAGVPPDDVTDPG